MELKKNWKCKIGFHDYEYIESIDKYQLKENIIAEIENRLPCALLYGTGTKVHKICLRCGKEINTIFFEELKIITEYRRKKYREEKIKLIQELKAKR